MSRLGVKYGAVAVTERTLSESSPKSIRSEKSSPSLKETDTITSTWSVGLQTPTLMIACYLAALAIAICHLLLFKYLDGKEADGPNEVAPQSYISTASNILANTFGFALRGALAVAFVQHLWHLLRVYAMKVSTIDLLFCIRTDFFVLFRWAVISAAPVLYASAALMWATQIVTSFPPGAITVTTTQRLSYGMVTVPTFNASFIGNGSGADADLKSLATLNPSGTLDGFTVNGFQDVKDGDLMFRLAFPVMVKGEAFTESSPCGVNCSYVTEFEGPYFECSNSSATYSSNRTAFAIYTGLWRDPRLSSIDNSHYNGTYSIAYFNSTILTPLALDNSTQTVSLRQDNLICLPARAKITVNTTYINNVQSRMVSSQPIDRLINLEPITYENQVIVPGFCSKHGYGLGTTPANWSDYALAFYRDVNMLSIMDALMFYLQGTVVAYTVLPNFSDGIDISPFNTLNHMPGLGNGSNLFDVQWSPRTYTDLTGNAIIGPQCIIDNTRFNEAFSHFKPAESSNPNIKITQDSINEQLLNVTTSMMTSFGTWNTTVNATISNTINIYTFSRPLNLILPYFGSLLLAIPFIVLGGLSLFENGVSAMDGSFTQILATSTGSAVLDHAAAGGCLGGSENIPQELKDLKIRFGEIIDREKPGRIRRAGFGVQGEVTDLKKGMRYGIPKWI